LLAAGLGEVHSQQRRTRPSRRATSPTARTTPPPTPTPTTPSSEPKLISTADDDAQEDVPRRTTRTTARRTASQEAEERQQQEQLRSTVNQLSTQVERISEDLTEMKTDQRVLFELERLTRAEQRAESLRAQLRDVTDKEFQHQERLAQIEDELQPDAIQRRAAVYGTINPSALREQIARGLERERERVRKQLELTTNSRVRLEAAVGSADQEVEKLRQRVEAADQQRLNPGPTSNTTGATTQPIITPATPQPTPTPAEPPQ
jgi:DNA repair exonuclease SbcCD ATPase subunit